MPSVMCKANQCFGCSGKQRNDNLPTRSEDCDHDCHPPRCTTCGRLWAGYTERPAEGPETRVCATPVLPTRADPYKLYDTHVFAGG